MKILKSFRPGLYDWKIENRTLHKRSFDPFFKHNGKVAQSYYRQCHFDDSSMMNGRGKNRIFQSTFAFYVKFAYL